METQTDLLNDTFIGNIDRKALIPLWIKIFSWIFLLFGIIAPVGFLFSLFDHSFYLSLYGFQTNNPLSILGLLIITLFILKGTVAFGILSFKSWAVKLAIIDAIIGIAACTFSMIYVIYNQNFSFRLELIALIPYLIKMRKIKSDWESAP